MKPFLLPFLHLCFLLQATHLATPSQVRSISCSAESDGRALLTVNIEGGKEVAERRTTFIDFIIFFLSLYFPLLESV